MTRIIHSINSTLNGTCFHEDVIADAEHHHYATELIESADVLLLGRRTYDLFCDFWPSASHRTDLPDFVIALAKALTQVSKVVISSRDLKADWENTIRVDSLDLLQDKLAGISGDAVVFGSPGLAASLAAEGLLDEVHILLQPLFSAREPKLPSLWQDGAFQRESVTHFSSGVVLLHFCKRDMLVSRGVHRG